jgi:hypothetical protein
MGVVHLRSQILIADLAFTAGVFALVFFFLALTLNDSVVYAQQEFDSMRAKFYSEQIASLVTLNPGVPSDWQHGNMFYPGVVDSENKLNFDKLDAMMAMDLNETFQIPYPTSFIIEEVTSTGFDPFNCSQYLITKYGNCTYEAEARTSRLLYSGDKVYRLQVIIDG